MLRVVAQTSALGSAVYYMDGSVDTLRGMMSMMVVTSSKVLSWRIPNHCSTLQMELVVIQHTVKHAQHCQEETVGVHSNSRSIL